MVKKIKLPDGRELTVDELEFETVTEDWNEYKTRDGLNVKMKTVVQRILRVIDDDTGEPASTADGEPNIIVRSSNQVVAREG